MGVIDRLRGVGKAEDGEDGEEENLYMFSSRPTTPGERKTDLLVRFQAVSRTQPCVAHHYMLVSSRTKLAQVRRYIQKHFKAIFEGGFIFLCKTKEILKESETYLTVFDVLPKMPCVDNRYSRKYTDCMDIPAENFLYPGVQYKSVPFEVKGQREVVTCACVVFLFERSKVSHWPPETLREELSANMLDGFCCVPTDIMSWKEKLVESRATLLHNHAASGTREELETAIQQLQGNMHDLRDQRNAVPLHYAAENGRLEICECLIAGLGKEMIYQRDINEKTPLHCSLYRRKIETSVYLLQVGSDLARKDVYGNSCIDLLLKQKDTDIEFVVSKLQIDCVDEELRYQLALFVLKKGLITRSRKLTKLVKPREEILEGQTLLHMAARLGDKECILNLVQSKFDILQRDILGFLPFHILCKEGKEENIGLLFSGEISDKDCCRGIQLAIKKKSYAICDIILSKKPSLEMDEQTVCMVLERLDRELKKVGIEKFEKQKTNVMKIAKSCFPLLRNQKGVLDSYVFDCTYYNIPGMLQLLKSLGANLESTDCMGRTPLHESAERNNLKLVEILLKAKINPNVLDWRNSSALHYACAKGHLHVVKLLMKMDKIKTDTPDARGRTPILLAAYYERKDVIEYLLTNHSQALNLHALDADGYGLLHYAIGMPDKLVDLLCEKLMLTDKKPQAKTRLRKKWTRDDSENIAWNRQVIETNFSSPYLDLRSEWISQKSYPSSLRKECGMPFQNRRSTCLWNSRNYEEMKRTETKPPKKTYNFCKGCQKAVGQSHRCSKLAKLKYPDGKVIETLSVRSFRFHYMFQSDSISPIFTAARAGNVQLIKKFLKFDPNYKNAKDEFGRNLLEFCIDQGSVKLFRAVQELQLMEEKPSLVHRLIMQKKKPKTDNTRKFLLEALISKGCLVDDVVEQSNMIKHDGCVLRKNIRTPCFKNCHLLGYTPLEVIVRNKDDDLIKLVLDKLSVSKTTIPLLIAAYVGNHGAIELISKKVKKNETLSEQNNNTMCLDEHDILNIACTSPNVNLELVKVVCKCFPMTIESNTVNKKKSLPTDRTCLFYDLIIHPLNEITILGKLLSADHPLYQRLSQSTRTRIEDIGCFLVESGINMNNINIHINSFDKECVHGACEALLNAVQNRYYRVAEAIIKSAGDIIWNCAFSTKPCLVQSKFKRRKFDRSQEEKRTINVNFIMYILMSLAACKVPETVLLTLLRSGEKNLTKETNIDTEAINEEDRQDVDKIEDPLRKLLLCVCKLMTLRWQEKFDVTKLLKFYPALVSSLMYVDSHLMKYMPAKDEFHKMLHAAITLISKKISYCKRNGKIEEIKLPENLSLLHIFSAVDNVDNVKALLKTGVGLKIDARAKDDMTPIDVAAACGNWHVFKYLQEHGGTVTSNTLMACCSTEKFKGIDIWTVRIHTMTAQEHSAEKNRLKIVKDICRKDNRTNSVIGRTDLAEALGLALNSQLWDIAEYILHLQPQSASLSVFMNMPPSNMIWALYAPEKTVINIVDIIIKVVSRESNDALALILLYVSQRTNCHVIDSVLTTITSSSKKCNMSSELLDTTDNHGMNLFHYLCRSGFLNAVQNICNLCQEYNSKLTFMNSLDKSQASPLWYALTYKHWDLANCILVQGAILNTSRSIPGLEPRKAYRCLPKTNYSLFQHKGGLIVDKHFKTLRKTFPQFVNTSYEISECIAPSISCFLKRKKYVFNPTKHVDVRNKERKHPTTLDENRSSTKQHVKHKLILSSVAKTAGCYLIHFACSSGNLKLVEELLQNRPELVFRPDHEGYIPFAYAVVGGNLRIIDLVKGVLNKESAKKSLHVLIRKCYASLDKNESRFKALLRLLDLFCSEAKLLQGSDKTEISYLLSNFRFDKFHNNWPLTMKKIRKMVERLENPGLSTVIDTIDEIKSRLSSEEKMDFFGQQTNAYSESYLSSEEAKKLFDALFEYISLKDIDDVEVLTLLMLPVDWSLDVLLKASKTCESEITRKVFWNCSIIDCCIVMLRPNDERQIAKIRNIEKQRNSVQNFIKTTKTIFSARIGIIAMKKDFWEYLECISNNVFEREGSFDDEWHTILSTAAAVGELKILKSVLDKIHIPKMGVQQKACFTAYLCLACINGRTEVVKYLLRHSVPIVGALDEYPVRDILGQQHRQSWNVLHYSLKSKSETTLKAIVNACKTEKEFVASLQPDAYVTMAGETGIASVFDLLINFFEITHGNKIPRSQMEDIYITSAKQGHEDMCLYLIQEKKVDVNAFDRSNRTALHYCGLLGMKRLCNVILDVRKDGLLSKDIEGITPLEYAELQGRTSMVREFMLPNLTNREHFQLNHLSGEYIGWLTCLLQKNTDIGESYGFVESSPHVFKSRELTLDRLLKGSDDNAASFIIGAFPHAIRKLIETKSSECELFHFAARYKCNMTLKCLCDTFMNDSTGKNILQKHLQVVDKRGYTPLNWAIKVQNMKGIELLLGINDCSDTEGLKENILHTAVKTGNSQIVQFVDEKTKGLLREVDDPLGLTPKCYALALGLQWIARIITDKWDDSLPYNFHSHKTLHFSCVDCLLDRCIGWSKVFLEGKMKNCQPEEAIRPVSLRHSSCWLVDHFTNVISKFDRHFYTCITKQNIKIQNINFINKWCSTSSDVIKAALFVMGYNYSTLTAQKVMLNIEDQQEAAIQALKKDYREATVQLLAGLPSEKIYRVLKIAAATGKKYIFEKYNDQLAELERKSAGDIAQTAELSVAFGYIDLGFFIDSALKQNEEYDNFRTFSQLRAAIPQKILWLTGCQTPGDTNWVDGTMEEGCRLTLPDIWISTNFSSEITSMIEERTIVDNIIPEKVGSKKFNVDMESFKKHKILKSKSEIWIRSFISSSQIYGHIRNLIGVKDAKATTLVATKVICLPAGSSDHPKVFIDSNGTLQETFSITTHQDVAMVHHENTYINRQVEIDLKEMLTNDIIPDVEQKLYDAFALNIKIKIDWNSIDMRKRSSGSETILKILTGDLYGNPLGGLNDVVLDCNDMKTAIEDYFNKETSRLAVEPSQAMKYITIAFVDNLTSSENQQSSRTIPQNFYWRFALDRSGLRYDRTAFPLWHILNKYRAACVAFCDSVYTMSHFHPSDTACSLCSNTQRRTTLRDKTWSGYQPLNLKPFRSKRSLTLEIDWKSFNINNEHTLLKLIGEEIARELCAVAFDCCATLRLKLFTDHVIVRNSATVQYTGVSMQGQIGVVNVYVHQTGKKQWIVENGNTHAKLAEIEDKQLIVEWPFELFSSVNNEIKSLRKNIEDKFGIKIDISIDVKRLVGPLVQKCRRDLTHPHHTVPAAIRKYMSLLQDSYRKILFDIFASPYVCHCREIKVSVKGSKNIHPGVWKIIPPQQRKALLSSQQILIMKSTEKPKRVTEHYGWFSSIPEQRKSNGYYFHEDDNYHSRQTFLVLSSEEVSRRGNIAGSWKNVPLKTVLMNKDGLQRASDVHYISSDNNIFQVIEPNILLRLLSKVPNKVAIGYDVLDSLDTGSLERLERKLYPTLMNEIKEYQVLPSISVLHDQLHRTNNFEGVQHLPNIFVDWGSFVEKCSSEEDRNLQINIQSLRDTLKLLFQQKTTFCSVPMEKQNPADETLRKITMLRIKKIPKDFQPDATFQDRVIVASDKRTPDLYLRRTYEVTIAYKSSPVVKPYSGLLLEALVQLIELEVKNNIFRYLDRKLTDRKKSKIKPETQTQRPRPELSLVVRILPWLLKTIKALLNDVPTAKTELSETFVDFQFASTESETSSMHYENGIILYEMSHRDLSRDFSQMMLIALELPFSGSGLDIRPVMNYDGPSIRFSAKGESSITISVNTRYGNPISQDEVLELYNPENFCVKVWKNRNSSATVPITKVERGAKESCIKVLWDADDFKPYKKRNIQLLYLQKGIGDHMVSYFHGSEPLMKLVSMEDDFFKIEKGGFMVIMTSHDTTCYIPADKKSQRTKEVRMGNITFVVTARKPKRPKYENALPITVQHIKTKDDIHETECFQITCDDCLREVAMYARCEKCGYLLQLNTPLKIIPPGKSLMINM